MSMPRRQRMLLGVFLVLLVSGVAYSVYSWRQAQKSAAHRDAMYARAEQHRQLNPSAIGAGDEVIQQQAAAAPAAKIEPGPEARIEPIRLLWKESEWEGGLLLHVDGCLPIASDTDLVWQDNNLFLMKEPGRLERLWSDPNGVTLTAGSPFGQRTRQPCFDGRYIWAATGGDGLRRLIVIDPRNGKATEFGSEAAGLFNYGAARGARARSGMMPGVVQQHESIGVSLAPVSPGVVCAFFTAGDSWLALLHFDAENDRREVEPIDLPPAMNLAAHREQLFPLETTVAGQPTRRVVVGRDWTAPLVLDPGSRQVKLAPANSSLVGFRTGHWCLHDGAVWWQRKLDKDDRDTLLLKATLPELKEEVVLSKVPSALLASTGRDLLLVGDDCWLLQPNEQTLQRLEAECAWTFMDRLEPPPAVPAAPTTRYMPAPAPVPQQEEPPIAHDFFATPPDEEPAAGRRPLRPKAVYRSAVYGFLVEASPNFGEWKELYRISFDDMSLEDVSPDSAASEDAEPAQTSGAGSRQAAATTSRLTIARRSHDPAAKSRTVVSLAGPVEPHVVDWRDRLPVLARELVRQSLLLAAATEFPGASIDEAIGESPDDDAAVASAEFQIGSWFRDDGVGEVSLYRANVADADDNEPIWRQSLALLNEDGLLDYRRLSEAAERWSRDDFPILLRASLPDDISSQNSDALSVEADDAAVEDDDVIERKLATMSVLPQFEVIRACAGRVLLAQTDKPDQSEHRLGALVRGYANLGLLTEHHWTMAHKVFQARALLYAQRWVAHDPTSVSALWHRAYADALAGLPATALDDIAQADAINGGEAASAPRPAWVDIVAASCRCDDNALHSYRERDDVGQLAGLLRCLHLSRLQMSALASEAAKGVLERQPDCDRVYDAMCDCGLPDELRESTAAALSVFQERFPARLREAAGLPAPVAQMLDATSDQGNLAGRLSGALLDMPDVDGGGLSWQALGSLAGETLFLECWRRAHLLRFNLGDECDEFLASAAPLVARHPFRPLLDFYGDSLAGQFGHAQQLDETQRKAAAELTRQIDLARLNETQQRVFSYFIGPAWQVRRPEQYAAAVWRPAQHRDDVVHDLLDQIDPAKRQRLLPAEFEQFDHVANIDGNPARAQLAARRLEAIQPGNPDALAAAMRVNPGQIHKQFDQLLERYQGSPQVLRALARTSSFWGKGYQALAAYMKLSPDAWAYAELANSSLEGGDLAAWQALLDEYLGRVPDGEQATAVRLKMAGVLLSRAKYEAALPYALAAAEKKSETAMNYVIQCYQGLGDDEQEGVWHERIEERYASAVHAREHYLWSRRTGLGDSQALADRALARIGQGQLFAMPFELRRYAAFYWLSHRLDDAIRCYELAAEMDRPQGNPAFSYLSIALLNQEKNDAAARDEALAQISDVSTSEQFLKLAKWLEAGFAAKSLDVDEAQELAATAPRNDQPAINFLIGYALLLSRQPNDAVPFLETAATLNQGATAPSRTLAAATLRDRGLNPGPLQEPTE